MRSGKRSTPGTRSDDSQSQSSTGADHDAAHEPGVPLVHLSELCHQILFQESEEDARSAVPERPAGEGAGTRREATSRTAELEDELAETRDDLPSLQEQAEASNEELQAGNEEVQSANQTLQSINEELSTRNSELTRVNNDLINLQDSARLPLLLLGRDLALRRFSPQAEKQFELRGADLGRPVGHLRLDLFQPDETRDPKPFAIEAVAAEVLSSLREAEIEVRDRAGRWHVCRIRPYLTLEGGVDGAVVVLIDIHAVRMALEQTLAVVRANREPLLVLDRDLRVRIASDSFYEHYRVSRAETEGRLLYELGNGQWSIPGLRHLLDDVLPKNTRIEDYEVEHEFEHLGRKVISLHARRFGQPDETKPTILLTLQDVTERRRAEREVRRSHDELMAHADELTRFNTAAVGRELRMIELKREVNDLCQRLGEHPRYDPRLTEGG